MILMRRLKMLDRVLIVWGMPSIPKGMKGSSFYGMKTKEK
jgi:hypothetical protein